MRFAKYHGTGNDFVMVEDLDDRVQLGPAAIASLCDRRFGVGADGLIRVVRGDGGLDGLSGADFFMDYYNANGEVAEMCGNGIRCLAKYVADRGLFAGDELAVDTRDGVKRMTLERDASEAVSRVRVDMGSPILDRAEIPLTGT